MSHVGQLRSNLALVLCLSVASMLLGTWELIVTRQASVLYFFDLTYLALSVCLLGLGVGALWARRFGKNQYLSRLLLALPLSMPVIWWLISRYDLAWAAGTFALPFVLFGAASTIVWHQMIDATSQVRLYAGEVFGAVIGLVLIGPLIVPVLPIDVFGDVGVQTHLRTTVAAEGVVLAQSDTSSYARTDLLHTSRDSVAYLFTDAMFVTRSVQWDGESTAFTDPYVEDLARLKRMALLSGSRERVLLLGAGAGFDLAVALQLDAKRIDAVEVNSQTITFARSLDDWAGGVTSHPNAHIYIAEARRFLMMSQEKWDHINLTLMQTSPAAGRGRSHVDGRVLTVKAMQAYLAHLEPGGVLAIIQNSPLLAERTYQALLVANDGDREKVLEWQIPVLEQNNNPFSHLVIARNEPFDRDDVGGLTKLASTLNINRFIRTDTGIAAPISTFKPATDDRPYMFEPGFRLMAPALLAASLALTMLIVQLGRERRVPGNLRRGAGAALIGALTMALQVLVIYRVQTAVGSPALAMSIALGAVLGGAGVGALLIADKIASINFWRYAGLSAACGVALLVLLGPWTVAVCASLSEHWAALLMLGVVAVCCAPIGLPFLAVIETCRSVSGQGEGLAIGCDGLGGVVGAAAATMIAMTFGFNWLGLILVLGFCIFILLRPDDIY